MNILRRMLIVSSLIGYSAVLVAGDITITYFHNDATGSPVAATNEAGEVIWRKTYTPYGEATGKDGDNRRGFTGHVEDQSGLIYMGARYYNPDFGRFMSVDPLGFNVANLMSFNRYSYANNNPYKYVDPDGREVVYANDSVKNVVSSLANKSTNFSKQLGRLEKSENVYTYRARDVAQSEAPGGTSCGQGGCTVTVDLKKSEQAYYADVNGNWSQFSAERVIAHETEHAVDYDIGGLLYGAGKNIFSHSSTIDGENKTMREANPKGIDRNANKDKVTYKPQGNNYPK